MAMFRVATLFSVLLGVLVKNVAGVRGLPQPEAMVETELTSWREDPCEKYAAKSWFRGGCNCPQDRPRHTKECGGGDSFSLSFFLSEAQPGCRCVTKAEFEELMRLPVAASALKFCEAVVEFGHRSYQATKLATRRSAMEDVFNTDMQFAMEDALNQTSPEICQHALTGTINQTEAEEFPWAEEASNLSHQGSAEDEDEKYGRMRAVKESATTSGEKKLWKQALARVCKDECDDLLKMMKKEAIYLADDVAWRQVPFAQACAENVVQQVEGEILGCCGRSCGFNGQTCLLWPFFSAKEKVDWEVECCSEMSVLKNSSRELMCNSVLPDRLAIAASKFDLNEQAGTDIGKVLIGQNSSLVWTEEGAEQSKLGKEAGVHEGEEVSMDFLLANKDVGEEFLRRGFFREKPLSKMLNEATSLMEENFQDDTSCDFGKLQQQCPKKFHETYMKTCQDSWMVADEEDEPFMDQVTGHVSGNCSVNNSTNFATPADCDKLANQSSDEILVVYFTHDHDNKEKPIACVTVGKKQCHGRAQWWEEIQVKSVQDMMNGPEIKDYTDSVYYVKVKADSKQTKQ